MSAEPREAGAIQRLGWRMMCNHAWCYYAFMFAVGMLTIIGIVMVFSSSSVYLISAGSPAWKAGVSQMSFALLGALLIVVALFLQVRWYRRYACAVLLVADVFQGLTLTPLKVEVNGNAGWVRIAGITMQPAEMMKLAFCLALPAMLLRAKQQSSRSRALKYRAYTAVLVNFAISLGLVMVGKDLGTALILVLIGMVSFVVIGMPPRMLGVIALLLVVGVVGAIAVSPNRMNRIFAAYRACSSADLQSVCYQAIHAKYAIASGGFWGVGIGNSREKWNYLPEANNDFIFAIIGEEMGFVGAIVVMLLFILLGWALIYLAIHHHDTYMASVLVAFAVWIESQALINIAVVLGLAPVMGVPLPFVSAGGSSLTMCLAASGVALSMMRTDREIRATTRVLHA